MISAADIQVELTQKSQNKRTSSRSLFLLLVSLGIFAASGLLNQSWMSLGILILVLFIHESGHWLGMKFYGYRDLQMFFIPFFGAAVTGKDVNVSSTQRAIVMLLGPAPGIILGIVSGFIYLKCRQPIFLQFGFISLLINGFNLLPIFPLDGGKFMQIVIFSRHPILEVLFKAIAVLLLAGLALKLASIPLGFLALITGIAAREAFYQAKIVRRLKEVMRDLPASETIPLESLEAILPELPMGLPGPKITAKILANRAESVWRQFPRQAPKTGPTLVLLGVYVGVFRLGIAGAFGLIVIKKASVKKTAAVHSATAYGQWQGFLFL